MKIVARLSLFVATPVLALMVGCAAPASSELENGNVKVADASGSTDKKPDAREVLAHYAQLKAQGVSQQEIDAWGATVPEDTQTEVLSLGNDEIQMAVETAADPTLLDTNYSAMPISVNSCYSMGCNLNWLGSLSCIGSGCWGGCGNFGGNGYGDGRCQP